MSLSDELGDLFGAARSAARAGRYQLLLGAGASLGAKNAKGPLPDAKGLVSSLAKKFPDAHIDDTTRLTRAYQRAVQVATTDEVWWFFRELFFQCEHKEWFTHLAGLPWGRVWTLNIDDTFERAYVKSVRANSARLRVIDWVDSYIEPAGPEIVHLHGTVGGPKPSPIIFSMREYHAAAEAHGVWHKVLRGVLAGEPVVIVGARILDDIDIESLVMSAQPNSYAPSVIVDPYISDDNAWELGKSGYKVIRSSGEGWVEEWQKAFGLDPKNLESLYSSAAVNLPQIRELSPGGYAPAPSSHDLFGGSEPLWSDACQEFIAEFEWANSIAADVKFWAAGKAPGVVVRISYVQRLAGATAGLLWVAHHVNAYGIRTLQFDRSVRFVPDRFIDMIGTSAPTLLVVDGGYAFADDLNRLALLANDLDDLPLYILLVDRPHRASLIEDHLATGQYKLKAEHVSRRRTRRDAQKIVNVLSREGRLGQLESKTQRERVEHFFGQDVFSAMSEVEYASGFRARLEKEIAQLSVRWHKDLVLLLALASYEGAQVSLVEASFALDTSSTSIVSAVKNSEHLGALVEVDGNLLLARHRLRGIDALLRAEGGSDFLKSLASMLQRLSEVVSDRAHKARTRASSLVRLLMSAKILRDIFPNIDIDILYQQILPQYGDWNARYWEQRSIYARLAGHHDRAVSFSERAVSVWDDSFTRNTLAVNLMSKATALAGQEDAGWRLFYDRAIHEFEFAKERDRAQFVSRWACLTSLLELISVLEQRAAQSGMQEPIDDLLDQWSSAYAEYRISLPRIDGSIAIKDAEKLSSRYTEIEQRLSRVGSPEKKDARREVVLSEIRTALARLNEPTELSRIASSVAARLSADLLPDWGGFGTFKKALVAADPDAKILPERSGTYVPAIHADSASTFRRDRSVAADDLLRVIRAQLAEIRKPTSLAFIAQAVARQLRLRKQDNWCGFGSFKAALLEAAPDTVLSAEGPGYVLPNGD